MLDARTVGAARGSGFAPRANRRPRVIICLLYNARPKTSPNPEIFRRLTACAIRRREKSRPGLPPFQVQQSVVSHQPISVGDLGWSMDFASWATQTIQGARF
jgi:hypothetical protein